MMDRISEGTTDKNSVNLLVAEARRDGLALADHRAQDGQRSLSV